MAETLLEGNRIDEPKAAHETPPLWIAEEIAAISARLTVSLQAVADAVNALNDRIAALDKRLSGGSATDHNAELLGKALQHLASPK